MINFGYVIAKFLLFLWGRGGCDEGAFFEKIGLERVPDK